MAEVLPQGSRSPRRPARWRCWPSRSAGTSWWLWQRRGTDRAAPESTPASTPTPTPAPGRPAGAGLSARWRPCLPAPWCGSPCSARTTSAACGPGSLLRIPIEAMVLIALVLVLPARPARLLVLAVGVLLALASLVRILDIGFRTALNRPFNPLTDWSYLGPALRLVGGSVGQWAAIVAVVAAVVVGCRAGRRGAAVGAPAHPVGHPGPEVGFPLRRLRSRCCGWSARSIGLQVGPGVPVAAAGVAQLTTARFGRSARASPIGRRFAAEIADDPVAAMPTGSSVVGTAGQERGDRVRRELRPGRDRGSGAVTAGGRRARCRHRGAGGSRLHHRERLSHLTDLRRHQLARPFDTCSPVCGWTVSNATTSC